MSHDRGYRTQALLQSIRKKYSFYFIAVLCLAAVNLFLNLGMFPVQDWDEARHGTSAFEMLAGSGWFRTTYLGQPDYWNLKPPLGQWLIALAYGIFGVSVFSLRFFSALSALLCVGFLMTLARRKFDELTAVLSGLVLSTAFVFIYVHSGRSGDFDAQMALFILLCVFFLDKTKKHKAYYLLPALFASLSFLLKSFEAILPFSIILVYWLMKKDYRRFKAKDYLLFLLVLLGPAALWAAVRYLQDGSGFFKAMVSYDLLKRGTVPIEGHPSSNWFYLEPLLLKFLPWSVSFFLFLLYKNSFGLKKEGRVFRLKVQLNGFYQKPLFWIWILVPLVIVLTVSTKSEWYLNPLYPALSLWIGWHLADVIQDREIRRGFYSIIRRLGVPLVIAFVVIAEAAILTLQWNPVLSMMLNRKESMASLEKDYQKDLILREIPSTSGTKGLSIYSASEWSPSKIFIARVLKGLENKSIRNITEFISVESNHGYLLLENNPGNRLFIKSNQLEILISNENWLAAWDGKTFR